MKIITSEYIHEALDSRYRQAHVDAAIEKLRGLDFEAVAVRGFSGSTMGSIIAHTLGKHLIIVRKDKDKAEYAHAHDRVEGPLDWEPRARYVIVDDFVSTGDTIRAIRKGIGTKAAYVGTWLWKSDRFYPEAEFPESMLAARRASWNTTEEEPVKGSLVEGETFTFEPIYADAVCQ